MQQEKLLKVLVVHNRYQVRGGEDNAVDQEMKLLSRFGHDVELFEVSNHTLKLTSNQVRTAFRSRYSIPSKRALKMQIKGRVPDIVHVHNFFPQLSPSVFDACWDLEIPVVYTMHNFRPICANGLFLRNNTPCEKCLHGSAYNAAIYACYRDSHLASLAAARMIRYHRTHETWTKKVSKFIVLSEFSRQKYIEAGFPPEKLVVKPNFAEMILPEPAPMYRPEERKFALYVGRLSSEKGIEKLLEAWAHVKIPLKVVGEGPLSEIVRKLAPSNVEFLGFQNKETISRLMSQAMFAVIPSICYENFPLVLAEAWNIGLPVIASQIGSLATWVEEGKTGAFLKGLSPESWKTSINELTEDPGKLTHLSEQALIQSRIYFTPEANYKNLISIYQNAMQD